MDEDEQELPEKVDRVLSKIQLVVTLPFAVPPYDVFFRVKRRGLRRAPRVRADEIAHAQVQRRELPPQPVGFGVLAQSVQPPDGSPSQGVRREGARGDARVRRRLRGPSAGHGRGGIGARLPRGVRPRGSQPPAGHLPRPEGAEDADAQADARRPRGPG